MGSQSTQVQGRTIMAKPSSRIKLEGITELHEGDIIVDPVQCSRELVTDVRQVPFVFPLFKVRTLSRQKHISPDTIKDEIYCAEVRTESDGTKNTYLSEHTGPALRAATDSDSYQLTGAGL
jgi:hypothetical protein